jgi:2-amino-4-hydroxy-6-hydroxymethyldihydropteridine diphosphokinase
VTPGVGTPAAYVALGGNLGAVRLTFNRALASLQRHGCQIVAVSPAYRTVALQRADNPETVPPYWNAVCALQTALGPAALLAQLHATEICFGRQRPPAGSTVPAPIARWGSRTLDLDLLVYGQEVHQTPTLRLPHPELAHRTFVLQPLHDLAPQLVIPKLCRSVAHLLAALPDPQAGLLERDPHWYQAGFV